MGVAIGSLSLFSTMSLLLYFNLYAQSKDGLDVNAIQAGLLLVPLGVALLALALSASAIAARLGQRSAMTGGMALLAIGSAMVGAAITGGSAVLLVIGLAAIGGGLALPYALAPRLALSVLSPEQTGQGSGIINACTFLSGSTGVACSGIASQRAVSSPCWRSLRRLPSSAQLSAASFQKPHRRHGFTRRPR